MIVSRHLVEPAHHVPLELRLVLAGRLPAVAPGGGHVLAHCVPVWVYSIVYCVSSKMLQTINRRSCTITEKAYH